VGTVGNHEFDEGVTEMMRLFEGGNHVDDPFLKDPWKGLKVRQTWIISKGIADACTSRYCIN
jgi:2',3'-cyclic-nucleotide 2'-phosphodiesterase (5'-nucleotidase family)